MRKRLLNILFWSVLSAAFIGPGTITTAASSGTRFGFTLIWALIFSTVACIILQEASARLTVASGQNLGQALRQRMDESVWGKTSGYLVLVAILLGCAAYEAGNILGAVAGAALLMDVSTVALTLVVGIIAFLLLWFGSTTFIAQLLGVIVALMGFCFLTTAIIMQPPIGEIFKGMFVPHMPSGSELLVIGLIGTTVVPYNLFLGSGLKHSQSLKEMRISLSAAVLLGGIVSIGVLIAGSSIAGAFTYEALSESLGARLGGWASTFFAGGLAAAGISSALTAPLAAALTAQSMLGNTSRSEWRPKGRYMRLVWGGVLLAGITFGVLQVQPIPAIILAQALNGIILPLVTFYLFVIVNDRSKMGSRAMNSPLLNIVMGIVFFITLLLGITNLAKAVSRILPLTLVDDWIILLSSLVLVLALIWPLKKMIQRYRSKPSSKQ